MIKNRAASIDHWELDPDIAFLNHGSFGACPREVLDHQTLLRRQMEAGPVRFFVRELEGRMDQARRELARFIGANTRDLVFVPNATAGVNTVLRSLEFRPGDELLVSDHEYNACRNALQFGAERSGAKVVVAAIPFPVRSEQEAAAALLNRVTKKTRLVLVDHVTSQTGLVMPLELIIPELNRRGVEVLVDGAHAPGMIPLNLTKLAPAYYTGNCHKWLCATKNSALFYVREDLQRKIRPLSISHGANSPRQDRSRFLIEFGWTGTWDATAMLSVPKALEVMSKLLPGGWPAIMKRNRGLALAARKILCDHLEIEPPCPDSMIGSLASLPLWDSTSVKPSKSPLYRDELQEKLLKKARIEVPVIPWPAPPRRLLRISAQLYNCLDEYERLAEALLDLRRRAGGQISG